MSVSNQRASLSANQRRSQRILLSVPLRVSGKHVDGAPFVEHTNTLIVNAHGALIQLKAPVHEGQSLLLRNMRTGEEVSCKALEINPGPNGIPELGVEFDEPHPRFWRVSFPPADWSSRDPEAKRYASSSTAPSNTPNPPVTKK